MSQNNNVSILSTINQVEGFDPSLYAVEYVDLATQEKRKRLPVMAQLAWFRLKNPEGKIAVEVVAEKDYFVASARVYVSYKDPVDCYLSEATASRKYDPVKPTVSPREWAQTAAMGIALRNAGYGLQFGTAGDDFNNPVPDELGTGANFTAPPVTTAPVPPVTTQIAPSDEPSPVGETQEQEKEPEVIALTDEQRFEQACAIVSPIKKHGGRTLGEILTMEPRAISWLATKYCGDATIKSAAEFICTYALEQATA